MWLFQKLYLRGKTKPVVVYLTLFLSVVITCIHHENIVLATKSILEEKQRIKIYIYMQSIERRNRSRCIMALSVTSFYINVLTDNPYFKQIGIYPFKKSKVNEKCQFNCEWCSATSLFLEWKTSTVSEYYNSETISQDLLSFCELCSAYTLD